jgi:glycosyltransferase A (GT-A) superfamily protein (DUF2064 family)
LNNDIAILIFANSAEKDAVLKPFQSLSLFRTLNSEVITSAKKTGLPYFHYSEDEQTGNTFGERFTNAIQSVFNKGYNSVITIGNDTPHLKTHHLLKTAEKLKQHHCVLGPSKDGGFYLIGLNKPYFKADAFLKLPWQTKHLKRSVAKIFQSKGTSTYLLEQLVDIDSKEDIKAILDSFKTFSKALKTILITLIDYKRVLFSNSAFTVQKITLCNYYNKGPPL